MTLPNNVLYLGDNLMKNTQKRKADYQNSFEKLYLRENNLKKINNFDEKDLKKYETIVKVTSKIMYDKFKITYNKVGFYYDDIVSISRVYLYAYMGVYSFKADPSVLEKFKQGFFDRKGNEPSEDDIVNYERNIIINFIRQKLTTCSVFCERKSRNIVVGRNEKKSFAFTELSIPASEDLIMEDPKLFGYRVVNKKEFKSIVKNSKGKGNELVDVNGFKVFEIELLSQIPISFNITHQAEDGNITETPISDLFNILSTPSIENKILEHEDDVELDVYKMKFNSLETDKRKLMLKNFILKNNSNKRLKEELYVAKKMLKNINAVV